MLNLIFKLLNFFSANVILLQKKHKGTTMARPLRITFNGAWYHVMNRGVNRNRIFFNNENREKFLDLLNDITKVYGIEIHAFCLMDNHYHLIVHTSHGNISQAVRHLNSKFAQYINLTLKRDGPLFRGRFKAILISADDYLVRLSRYIHLNPREAGIINKLENYQWSSYQVYLAKRNNYSWLVTNEIIKRFGDKDFHKTYRSYVEEVKDEDKDHFLNNKASV